MVRSTRGTTRNLYNMNGEIYSTKKDGRIKIEETTMWTKTMIAVLVYFSKHNNEPATYREIARAYVSSSYSNFQKACEGLSEMAQLDKMPDGKFKVSEHDWKAISKLEHVPTQRQIPFANYYLKMLRK